MIKVVPLYPDSVTCSAEIQRQDDPLLQQLHNNVAQKHVEQINHNATLIRRMAASPHVPEVQLDYSMQQEVHYSMFRWAHSLHSAGAHPPGFHQF